MKVLPFGNYQPSRKIFDCVFAFPEHGNHDGTDRYVVWFMDSGPPTKLSNYYETLDDAEVAAYLFAREHNLKFVLTGRGERS